MKVKDFIFSDQDSRRDYAREEKLQDKINYAFDYLLGRLPINQLGSDGSFDFDTLKFDEGKNYDWFFLNNDEVNILVRQYSTHFTFFTRRVAAHRLERKLSVFTICDNRDKMSDDVSDSFCDDNFQSIQKYLPQLVELINEGKVHSIWNNYSLKREDYTDVKIALDGSDHVSSLDTLIFACDELFGMYITQYAQTDALNYIKRFKVGDTYGGAYTITDINTELDGDYYYNCGLELKNNNFPDSKPEWKDVYCLTRYYSHGLRADEVKFEKEVIDFVYENHDDVIKMLLEVKDEPFLYMILDYKYCEFMRELFVKANDGKEVDMKPFKDAFMTKFKDFINISFTMAQKKSKK